jgi:LytR cell envelope-related transcriptional attenuator
VTERSRFDRAWPSLVALVGTVAVVLALLWAFGGDVDSDGGDGDLVAGEPEAPGADDDLADDDAEPESTEPETTEPQTTEPPADPVTAPAELRRPVGILNATSVTGLAGQAQARFQDGGWSVPAVGDYSQSIEATTVYYPSGLQESAEALQAQFPEIRRVEPTVPGLAQDRLIVILSQDYADAVDGSG